MGEKANGEEKDSLRGPPTRFPVMSEPEKLQQIFDALGAGGYRRVFRKLAEAHSAAVADRKIGRQAMSGICRSADGSESDTDLRPAVTRAGVLRRNHRDNLDLGRPGSRPTRL